jgi:hypothetical protein
MRKGPGARHPTNKGKGKPRERAKATGASGALPPLPAFKPEDAAALLDTQRAMIDGMLAMNREFLDFAETRLRADIEVLNGLCRCKDWPQFLDVQSKFLSAMTEQYFDRTMRLMTTASRMLTAKRAAETKE